MTTYCAPCITDLALLREAVTAVGGTACCAAHAVLLTHPHDAPGRRRARLAQLRSLAETKSTTAPAEEQPGLELLMHEYTLAGAMDMGGQPRPDGSQPQRAERGERAERPGEPGVRTGKRRGRGRGERHDRPGSERPEGATVAERAGDAQLAGAPAVESGAASVVDTTSSAEPPSPAGAPSLPAAPDSSPTESSPALSSPAKPSPAPEQPAPSSPTPSSPAQFVPAESFPAREQSTPASPGAPVPVSSESPSAAPSPLPDAPIPPLPQGPAGEAAQQPAGE